MSYIRSIAFWFISFLPFQVCVGEQTETKTNIIFIIVDDLAAQQPR